MSRPSAIYFTRVGETKTGRGLYKLCGKKGKPVGRRFCIGKRKRHMKLHLHVKTEYFDQIKAGTKTEEYRLINDYWKKRLKERSYDGVVIYNAYKPGAENRLEFPWSGYTCITLQHKHFGAKAVDVYAIRLEKNK